MISFHLENYEIPTFNFSILQVITTNKKHIIYIKLEIYNILSHKFII